MKRPRRTARPTPRWLKLQRIGQAHLAPGMTLARWREILDRHGVGSDWSAVDDATVDAVVTEIGSIVRRAKEIL